MSGAGGGRGDRVRPAALRAAAALGGMWVLRFVLLDTQPFEWDEILFSDATRRFDVTQHLPHPPGYPAYVALGWALTPVFQSAGAALAVVTAAFFCAGLLAVYRIARSGGACFALAAPLLLFFCPASLSSGARPYSDAAALGAALLAVERLSPAALAPGRAAVGGVLAGLALGIRPTIASFVLPAAAVCLLPFGGRRWKACLVPVAAAAATCIVWLVPMVVLSGGLDAYRGAARGQWAWLMEHEAWIGAPTWPTLVTRIQQAAFDPWVHGTVGRVAWGLCILGIVGRARAGFTRAHAALAAAGLAYFAFLAGTMNPGDVRYALPVVAALAVFAADAPFAFPPLRWLRWGSALAFVFVLAVSAAKGLPAAWTIARGEPPVMRCLARAVEEAEKGGRGISAPPGMVMHLRYAAFGRPGLVHRVEGDARPPADLEFLQITAAGELSGGPVIESARWGDGDFFRLERGRYHTAQLAQASVLLGAGFRSHLWSPTAGAWSLSGEATVWIPSGATRLEIEGRREAAADAALVAEASAAPRQSAACAGSSAFDLMVSLAPVPGPAWRAVTLRLSENLDPPAGVLLTRLESRREGGSP